MKRVFFLAAHLICFYLIVPSPSIGQIDPNELSCYFSNIDINNPVSETKPCCLPETHCPSVNYSCTKISDPYVLACNHGLTRYLARSMSMQNLDVLKVLSDNKFDDCIKVKCLPPNEPDFCLGGDFCEEEYCEEIQLLVDLNVAFVRRAAGKSYGLNELQDFDCYWKAVERVVLDINSAYDCAGLMRPIVQAVIYEGVSSHIEFIKIPEWVKAAFRSDPDYDVNYYDNNGDVYFDPDNIVLSQNLACYTLINNPDYMDASRLEARMIIYWQARKYIDAGYTSIQVDCLWPSLNKCNVDPGNIKTSDLLQKLRNYAQSKGRFVLFNTYLADPYINGGPNLLLDFRSGSFYGTEHELVNNPIIPPECAGEYYTVIEPAPDPNSLLYSNETPGITPMGCYVDELPFFNEFDHGGGYCGEGEIGVPSELIYCTYGLDDVSWMNTLSDECLSVWITENICRIQDLGGYLQMPGRLVSNYPNHGEIYRLSEHPDVVEAIAEAWTPQFAEMEVIQENCAVESEICWSKLTTTGLLLKYRYNHRLKGHVTNRDCTSNYSWHILKPTNTWFNTIQGPEFEIEIEQPGLYKVYLRQDNLGFPASYWGTYQIMDFYVFPTVCCGEPY